VDIKRISRISQEMSLDIPTAEKFWPRYQEYLHRLIALRDKQLATLSSYATRPRSDIRRRTTSAEVCTKLRKVGHGHA
jgi:hypothetical protein